jgi:hypothetical protein
MSDAVQRKALKGGFVETFGMPHSLTADQVPDALAWLADQGAPVGEGPAAADQAVEPSSEPPAAAEAKLPDGSRCGIHGTDTTSGRCADCDADAEVPPHQPMREGHYAVQLDPDDLQPEHLAAIAEYVAGLPDKGQLVGLIELHGTEVSGRTGRAELEATLAQLLADTGWWPGAQQAAAL